MHAGLRHCEYIFIVFDMVNLVEFQECAHFPVHPCVHLHQNFYRALLKTKMAPGLSLDSINTLVFKFGQTCAR